MQDFLITTLSATVSTSVLLAALGLIFRKWIVTRIEHSIKHEYDIQLEKLKDDLAVRSRAALVGELLAEWLSHPDDRKYMNRLTFEAFLWLPEDIAKDLTKLLSLQPNHPSVRDVIIKVRTHLLGNPDGLTAPEVIVFPKKEDENEQTLGGDSERRKDALSETPQE